MTFLLVEELWKTRESFSCFFYRDFQATKVQSLGVQGHCSHLGATFPHPLSLNSLE